MKKLLLPLGGVLLLGLLVAVIVWWSPLLAYLEEEKNLLELLALVVAIAGGISAVFAAIVKGYFWWREWQSSNEPAATQDLNPATQTYLSFLIERYRYLDFRGMGVADRVPLRLPLVDMYVPLQARVELPEGDTHERRRARLAGRDLSEEELEAVGERLGGPQPVLDLLEARGGLVVLGDPGAGKSTFLKWLTLKLAMGHGDELGLGDRLPFLLPLSAYATALAEGDSEPSLVCFIADYVKSLGLSLPIGEILQQALEEGRALVLLDGLDEVRQETRRLEVVRRVQDFYALYREAGNKFIMSSRIVGYKEVRPTAKRLTEGTLLDFENQQIEEFVEKWTETLERAATGMGRVAAVDAEREREELLTAVHNHPGVRTLAANPLLLTILALMKRQGVALPERRVELYQKYVETLLKHWNLARSLDPAAKKRELPVDVLETLRVLAPLALWMQEQSPGVGLVKEVEMQDRLEEIFKFRKDPNPDGTARQFVDDLRKHSGLLLHRGGQRFGFIHLTFQEYLAAWALADQAQENVEPLVKALSRRLGEPEWREVSLLALGCLGVIQQRDRSASQVMERLIAEVLGRPEDALILVADAVADIGAVGVTTETRTNVAAELLRAMLNDKGTNLQYRAAAGERLARVGDPRFSAEFWYLPDEPLLGFVEVPAGPFLMGSDPSKDRDAFDVELPQHEMDLPSFFVTRFPVTVIQWRAFVESSNYEPLNQDSLHGVANHPAIGVSWYGALAYCEWLEDRLNETSEKRQASSAVEERFWTGLKAGAMRVTLPSEAEWEKAARGGEGRTYPWGEEPSAGLANYNNSGLGGPSPVGCFPGGASPFGCEEMAGNVWEWTRSLWGEYPYNPQDGREKLKADDELRMVRGGSFSDSRLAARSTYRTRSLPFARGRPLGFRVVCSPLLSNVPLEKSDGALPPRVVAPGDSSTKANPPPS